MENSPSVRGLIALSALLLLGAGCGGPARAEVAGTLVGGYPCPAAITCQRPLGNQDLVFQSSSGGTACSRSDADGRFAVSLGAGTWRAHVEGVAAPATPSIDVAGLPGEKHTVTLVIPIPAGGG